MSWIDKMVHPNLSYWETGEAMPQNKASLTRRNKFNNAGITVTDVLLKEGGSWRFIAWGGGDDPKK